MARVALLVAALIAASIMPAGAQSKTVTSAWHSAYAHPSTFELHARSNMAVTEFMANHGLLGAQPTFNFATSNVTNIGNLFQSSIDATNSTVSVSSGQDIAGGNNQDGNATARSFTGDNRGISTSDIVKF